MSDEYWGPKPGEVFDGRGEYPAIKPPPPGVPVNALAATQILLDLIAELRATGCVLHLEPIDRAEARLREVGGDE